MKISKLKIRKIYKVRNKIFLLLNKSNLLFKARKAGNTYLNSKEKVLLIQNKIRDQNQLVLIKYSTQLIKALKMVFFKEFKQAQDFLNKNNKYMSLRLIFPLHLQQEFQMIQKFKKSTVKENAIVKKIHNLNFHAKMEQHGSLKMYYQRK